MSTDAFDHDRVMGELCAILGEMGPGASYAEEHTVLYATIVECLDRLGDLARTNGRPTAMSGNAADIATEVHKFLNANAEGMGGPEGDDYQALIRTLIADLAQRAVAHADWYEKKKAAAAAITETP